MLSKEAILNTLNTNAAKWFGKAVLLQSCHYSRRRETESYNIKTNYFPQPSVQCRACLQVKLLLSNKCDIVGGTVFHSEVVILCQNFFFFNSLQFFQHKLNNFCKLLSRYVRKTIKPVPICQCSANIGASPISQNLPPQNLNLKHNFCVST